MLDTLPSAQRLQLMKFVCAFAWADLDVSGEEKLFVADCIRRLHFTDVEKKQVWAWLEVPPAADEIDPSDIPAAHRQAFIEAIGRLVAADDQITPREREALVLFSQLMM